MKIFRICVHTCLYSCVFVCMCVYAFFSMFVCKYMCVCVCGCGCVYVCVCAQCVIVAIAVCSLQLNFNLALGRPSMESDPYMEASLPNDGNLANFYPYCSCSYASSLQNWFAVDFGRLTYVGVVTITPEARSGNVNHLFYTIVIRFKCESQKS